MRNITGIFLLLLILFQSCTVYHKTSVSIEEATNQGKVKVVDGTGQEYFYDKIVLKDSIYYGIYHRNPPAVIRHYESKEIYMKDKKKSLRKSIIKPAGISAAAIIIIGAIGISLNL